MKIHELTLIENAADSLDEAHKKYRAAKSNKTREYKFVVLHMFHFVELAFKHYVSELHPLLIYKTPTKPVTETSQTIGLMEAIAILRNAEYEIPNPMQKDLEWIKNHRNQIMHHRVKISTGDVKDIVGRIFHTVRGFDEKFDKIKLGDSISWAKYSSFKTFQQKYEDDQKKLQRKITRHRRELEKDEDAPESWRVGKCDHCGVDALVPNMDSISGWKCLKCGNMEVLDREDICSGCQSTFSVASLTAISDEETLCPFCIADD